MSDDESRKIVVPAIDFEAVELLKNDPDEYFRRRAERRRTTTGTSWLDEPCPPSTDFTSHSVNRVELIDHRASTGKPGRVFTSTDVKNLMLSIQDEGRTLKIFLS